MPDSEAAPAGGPDSAANDGEEHARQFILQVKETVERCLAHGMNKAQMFRVIREEGLPPGIAFAVYAELRDQNHGFFKDYYCMIDLTEQREKLGRLIQAYHTGGSKVAAGAGVPATPTTAMETDVPVNTEWQWLNQQTVQARLDLPHIASSSDDGHQLAPAAWVHQQALHLPPGQQVPSLEPQPVSDGGLHELAWPHQAVHLPAGQLQLQNHGQPVANGGFHELVWPEQAVHLPAGPQRVHNHQLPVAGGGLHGLGWPEQAAHLPAGQQLLHNHQLPVSNGVFQGLAWPQQAVHLPAVGQFHYQELLMDNGGLHGVPLASAAGLPNDVMMGPWPPLHSGLGEWQGQQADPQQQWWSGAGANPSPSSVLSEDEPLENHNYRSDVSFHEGQ